MRHPILAAGFIEVLEAPQREVDHPGEISAHDLVLPGAHRVEGTMKGETIDRIAALIESSRALSGVLALVLASTPAGKLSASEIDALTDLSYKIHLDLDQLEKIWTKVSDEEISALS